MSSSQRHRGAHPEDAQQFDVAKLPRIFAAAVEVSYLLSRDYPSDPVFAFVGGHHQLHARQRLALRRIACSDQQLSARRARLLPIEDAASGALHVDGLNLIITLEVALSGGPIFRGRDGALRDLAGLRGTYHPVEETEEALRLLGAGLTALRVPSVEIYLDAPVANSGRLAARIREHAERWPFPVEVTLIPDPDKVLVGKPRVVSADGEVLDACASWLNLSAFLLSRLTQPVWRIETEADG